MMSAPFSFPRVLCLTMSSVALFLLITGVGCFEVARREFMRQWGHIQEEIEAENLRRDGQ